MQLGFTMKLTDLNTVTYLFTINDRLIHSEVGTMLSKLKWELKIMELN
jgi:hypothetical protein